MKPIGKGLKLNDFGVRFKLRMPSGQLKQVRQACSAELPCVADALRNAIACVKELGTDSSQENPGDAGSRAEYSAA